MDDALIAGARTRALPSSFLRAADVTDFVTTPSQLGEWQLQGLPADAQSTQSGCILTLSSRPVYCVDPQGQGVKWILAMEKQKRERAVEEPVVPAPADTATKVREPNPVWRVM